MPTRPVPAPEAGSGAHERPADAVLAALDTRIDGLSAAEAEARLARYGPNALRVIRSRSALRILLDQLTSVVVLLLLAATAVAAVVGEWPEAVAIGAVLAINVFIGFATELRARSALDALLEFEAPRARAVRDGRVSDVDARVLVPGDVVLLEAGDLVPADARLVEAAEARTDEAALTGESLPVEKAATDRLAADTPLHARTTMLYKGTVLVAGRARAVVVATGMSSEIGRIGGLVEGIKDERTPLERRLGSLGKRLIAVALGAGAIVTLMGVLRGEAWATMLKTGLALAIAAVPEGLPATITIALAVGIHRMARRRALTRRLPAVESLGAATVICTDKTGTLTTGQQTITEIRTVSASYQVTGAGVVPEGTFQCDGDTIDPQAHAALVRLLVVGAMANDATLEEDDGDWRVVGDPTDGAFLVVARKAGIEPDAAARSDELPFASERQLMAVFEAGEAGWLARTKGAPVAILGRCDRLAESNGSEPVLDDAARARLLAMNDELAAKGLRVLALAEGRVAAPTDAALRELVFLGFAGMIDPPAEGVKQTIAGFRDAGIRTIMLTGDQQRTAEAIGRDLGLLAVGEETMDGSELASIPDDRLADRVARVAAFSRVSPETKLRLVSAYRARGDIVAMLGDGVNDAAALRKADVGVAMGERGTDVARQAADVVLQDDRFPTIGAAIEEGRVIYDNIRKFVFYLFSCNLAEVIVLLGAGVAGLPLPLQPLQILWLNLVTDTFPALSLAMEPGEPDVMKRPPRDPEQHILSASMLRLIGVWGAILAAVTLVGFGITLDGDLTRAQTICFMTLAFGQLFHLGTARSRAAVLGHRIVSNRWALGAVVLVVLLQLLTVGYAPLARLLAVAPPTLQDWALIIGLSSLPAILGQVWKQRPRRRQASAATRNTIEP